MATGFKKILAYFVMLFSTLYIFYAVGSLMKFLLPAQDTSHIKNWNWAYNLLDVQSKIQTAFPAITNNLLYIVGFILQHSVMKSSVVKNIIQNIGFEPFERIIYNTATSLCLLKLVNNWKPAQSIILWNFDLSENDSLWCVLVFVHICAWVVIYGGCIVMDLPELLGIKQVYYHLENYSKPMEYKSQGLRRLLQHVRHPSITAITIILWVTNVMTADRLLLAVMLVLYMYLAWSTDDMDISYQRLQLQRKEMIYT